MHTLLLNTLLLSFLDLLHELVLALLLELLLEQLVLLFLDLELFGLGSEGRHND